MDDSQLWRLPGPSDFVSAIATSVERQQSVAAILPTAFTRAAERTGHLVNALVQELGRRGRTARPVRPYEDDGSLVAAIGCQVVLDEYPVTIGELLVHPDVTGRTLVCDTSELGASHLGEVRTIISRLERESRSIPAADRGVLVFVTDRSRVPEFAGGGRSDATFTSHWFWNRVARWDTAALVAAESTSEARSVVLQELRTETIVEIARWDLDLAARLASDWSGLQQDLETLLPEVPAADDSSDLSRGLVNHSAPGETLAEAWDAGRVGAWHERVEPAPSRTSHEQHVSQRIWTAQARVLLPWIEVYRQLLLARVQGELGSHGLQAAVEYANRGRSHDAIDADAVEIGPLHGIIQTHLRRKEHWLSASRHLKDARNELAHLRPMPHPRVEALVRSCKPLT